MTEQVSNKNWGEWGVLMFGALGIGTIGFLSTNLNDTVSAKCPENGNSEGLRKASNVALGTAIGIIIMAFSNKFDFNKSGMGRTGLIIAIGMVMLIIGAISFSPPTDSGIHLIDDEKAKTCSTQQRLGTILLGFGLGILIPSLIKLFVSIKNKGGGYESMKRNNELAVAFGTFILSLFATIVGSWSWNNFNSCKYSKSNVSSGFNGFATIVAALLTVYCIVFGVLRARNNVVATYMANFKK